MVQYKVEKVSFVILSWNSEKYLEKCLDSIINLKNIDYEIILVDNGSTDNSIDIIEKFMKKNNKIQLIKLEKNYGTTISRNKGLHKIKNTDYICILDSDTIINDNAILLMSNYLKKNSKVGIVGPEMINGEGERQIPYRRFPTWKIKLLKACPIKKISKLGEQIENYDVDNLPDDFECDYLISACWMMRFKTYKLNGDLDEKIFYSPEDVEYCMRVRKNNLSIVHMKNAQIVHFYQRISKKKLISKANLTHLWGIHYVLKKYKKFLKKYRKESVN